MILPQVNQFSGNVNNLAKSFIASHCLELIKFNELNQYINSANFYRVSSAYQAALAVQSLQYCTGQSKSLPIELPT